ncbi:MAG: hypothetical protein WDO06_05010 [Actinomycetota bacterium]
MIDLREIYQSAPAEHFETLTVAEAIITKAAALFIAELEARRSQRNLRHSQTTISLDEEFEKQSGLLPDSTLRCDVSVKPLRLGTRGSALARTQSEWVARHFPDQRFEFEIIKTAGDDLSLSLFSPGEPGAFVNALRSALLDGKVDLLVHSMKDLPSAPHSQLTFAAIPVREDARDVLISRNSIHFSQLPDGSSVGTHPLDAWHR